MKLKRNALLQVLMLSASLVSVSVSVSVSALTLDKAIPEYKPVRSVAGNLSSVGSDTLANLMTLWAEAFKKQYPSVNIQVQAAGSATAPPALSNGTANIGPMSRKMKDNEIEDFRKRFGYAPLAIPVAVDALAVYVHKDNPVKGLSMKMVDALFSDTRKCGYERSVRRWGDVGLSGAWAGRDLQLFGRNSVSGTYGYFKEHALCKGDFKDGVNEQPGSASVVQSVATSINGVGYSGIGYVTSGVRAVPLQAAAGQPFVAATAENALKGSYPLSRFLYVYVNKAPNKAMDPLTEEFIRLVLSRTGQAAVIKDGYIPLPAKEINKVLATLGAR